MKRFLLDPTKAAGDKYSPVVITPSALARMASSAETLRKAMEISARLASDPYTSYVTEFYRRGLEIAGESWHFMDIVSVLYAAAAMGQPQNYLEIGVRRGRSACAVVAGCPPVDIYAFDMWQEDYANSENPGPALVKAELARFGHTGTVTFVDGDSHKTVPEFMATNADLTFDLITVDGDHSIGGAMDDLRNVILRLRVGGVLVFDDTANPYCAGLMRVWETFLDSVPDLAGYSYNEAGTGISFAIRLGIPRRSLGADSRKSKGLRRLWS
jgi:predicted O-methyltransferase YrrM